MSPYNQPPGRTSARLEPFRGVTAYGTSAKGGTLAAYRTVCRSIIGGDLNVWRRFSGIPQPGEPMQICSTKDRSRTAMADRRAGFAAYGLPCVDVWWHEPFGGDGDYPATDAGYGLYLDDAEALLTDHATNVVRALCFQRADAVKGGNVDKALKTLPPYVDLLLFDGYRDKPVGGRTAKEMLAPCIAQSQRLGVGYGLAEWGVAGTAIERVKFGHELVEETCRDGGCYVLSHFESDVGDPDRVPTNYDGSKAWAIAKSSDRYTPEMSNLWRDLAALSRREAARLGSPATF